MTKYAMSMVVGGKMMLQMLTHQMKQVGQIPADCVVDFVSVKPSPEGDRIIFNMILIRTDTKSDYIEVEFISEKEIKDE